MYYVCVTNLKFIDMEELEYLTSDDVMKLLHIKQTTLWKYIKDGKLKPYKIGHRNLFSRSDIVCRVEA